MLSPSNVADLDNRLWTEFEEAYALHCSHSLQENVPPLNKGNAHSFVARLADGDLHVCGPKCRELFLNEDRCFVCAKSGFVFGSLCLRDDYSTGRQAGSSDPDAHAGEPVGGTWKLKKDMRMLSSQAYDASVNVDVECETLERRIELKSTPKRGARCVDEPENAGAPKRQRCPRRAHTDNRPKLKALADEAEQTLLRLINFDKKVDPKMVARQSSDAKPTNKDPRLLDAHAIFQTAAKKYIKNCMASGSVPTLDAIHNIGITAHNIAAREREKQQVAEGHSALILRVSVRQQVIALAVALWQACCATPYMEHSRRGADSFRPFVCGMLYALKRGMELPDGVGVVPKAPILAEALPALRTTAANSMAKALHASSHRGLCTLHRCISSCPNNRLSDVFEDAARLSKQIQASVRSGAYGF
tara:strand:- start:3272 stop:4522 length:1251 start_codon:yes stop_codon:yes gene_type:complete